MRVVLPEPNDKQIRSPVAKKRNDSFNFLPFDQVSAYLNSAPTPLCDGELHELLMMPPPIVFEAAGHAHVSCDDECRIYGRGFNHCDCLERRAQQFAKLHPCAQRLASRGRIVIRDNDFPKWFR
jgi:hypothetical protein